MKIEPLIDTSKPLGITEEVPKSTPQEQPPNTAEGFKPASSSPEWTPDELILNDPEEEPPALIAEAPAPEKSSDAEKPPTPVSLPSKIPDFHPPSTEVAVILANDQFFPKKIKLRAGLATRLIFTTINKKPAALIMEKLQLQRWIAKDAQGMANNETERAKWEVNRELTSSKITEILWEPRRGRYQFHDALSGAKGEIQVD